jgi:hypothetical protein
MRVIRTMTIAGIAFTLSACSSVETCEEPQFYEAAESGRRIEPPDDLDNIPAFRELRIPEASPRPPREPGSGCIDKPPILRVDTAAEDEGEEDPTGQ